MYDKRHNAHVFDFDLEIEVKTTIDDTICSVCERHLQEKALANEMVKEFDVFFDNRYIAHGTRNNQAVSHPCGNNPMKENTLYDGIEYLYRLVVEGSSSIRKRNRKRKKLARSRFTVERDLDSPN